MPAAPERFCQAPHCATLTLAPARYCATHSTTDKAKRALYNSTRWKRQRAAHLRRYPRCGDGPGHTPSAASQCRLRGQVTPATDVHHILEHDGDRRRFFDARLWESLCHSCHSMETRRGGQA